MKLLPYLEFYWHAPLLLGISFVLNTLYAHAKNKEVQIGQADYVIFKRGTSVQQGEFFPFIFHYVDTKYAWQM